MLPLKDENPTSRTPVATVAIILACLGLFFAWQPQLDANNTRNVDTAVGTLAFDERTAFNVENAAIPCELVNGRPLTVNEVVDTFTGTSDPAEACQTDTTTSPPVFASKNVWLSVVVSMFLHGGLLHLGGNMLFLWVFGNNIEDHLGMVRFLIFYILGGIVATGTHVLLNFDSTVPLVGASGAIAAVMGAYLVWFPNAPVRTAVFVFFIFLTDIRAKWLLGFWFVSQFFTNPNTGVAWAAHVGGFVFGVVVGLAVRSSRSVRSVTFDRRSRAATAHGWDSTGGVGTNPYRSRRLGNRRRF